MEMLQESPLVLFSSVILVLLALIAFIFQGIRLRKLRMRLEALKKSSMPSGYKHSVQDDGENRHHDTSKEVL